MGDVVGTEQLIAAIIAFPAGVVLYWILAQITRGDLKTKGHHDEVLAVRKESEERAWATVVEVRTELRESTRVNEKLADSFAQLARSVEEANNRRR